MNMNRFVSFIIALCVSLCAMAQPSPWFFGALPSPVINGNGTVTFRLLAPFAEEVKLEGDIFDDGRYETRMVKDAVGIWYYTTEKALESDLYTYRFVVDGVVVRDPQNTFVQRDVFNISNYFIVPGKRGELYSVQNVPHGSVQKCWYYSPVLKQERRMSVYTPPGYEKSDRRYPVLYLLHGMGGDEDSWLVTGRAAQILDNMIAQKRCVPMIVVMTNGNTRHVAAPGESPEGMLQPYMSGSFDTSFEAHFKDVVSYVDRTFRTVAKASGRAIAGLSMGGWHSYQTALNYPWLFNYTGLFSAAVSIDGLAPGTPLLQPQIYDNTSQKTDAYFEDIAKKFYIAIGKDDFLYESNKKLRRQLDMKGYRYRYLESSGGHDWRNWRLYLEDYLTTIFK